MPNGNLLTSFIHTLMDRLWGLIIGSDKNSSKICNLLSDQINKTIRPCNPIFCEILGLRYTTLIIYPIYEEIMVHWNGTSQRFDEYPIMAIYLNRVIYEENTTNFVPL